jgi:transcriptional regulator with XRE-family HTH domain
MNEDTLNLRKILSANIKKYRALLGISQEKLAEKAEISANMINDIEGCRTWVSDKTLIKIANTFEIEIYMLLLPISLPTGDTHSISALEIVCELQNIKKKFDTQFENALKSRGLG